MDQCSPIQLQSAGVKNTDGAREVLTTLDAVRKVDMATHPVVGVLSFSGYLSLSGLDVTPFHDEEYGSGSVFVLLRTEKIGWDAQAALAGKDGRTGPKGVKVWICLNEAETCGEEYKTCMKLGE